MTTHIDLNTYPHVDDFIDDSLSTLHDMNARYARWFLHYHRLPAALQYDFEPFMKGHKLFCKYKNVKFRVTGCSRLGDVWLNSNFNADSGYTKRVVYTDCSEWSKE
jgi:hypothetical protein